MTMAARSSCVATQGGSPTQTAMDFVDVLRACVSSVGGGLGVAVAVDLLLLAPVRPCNLPLIITRTRHT